MPGVEANGFFAVGAMATGVVAIGQVATGVIAIGQLARGVIAIGQVCHRVGCNRSDRGRSAVRRRECLAWGRSPGGLLPVSRDGSNAGQRYCGRGPAARAGFPLDPARLVLLLILVLIVFFALRHLPI